MLRKLSVRGKILAALAVPVLVLCLAASLFALQAIRSLQVAGQVESVVALLEPGEDVTAALANERAASIRASFGDAESETAVADARAATDAALAVLRESYADLDISLLDPAVTGTLASISVNNPTQLGIARDRIDSGASQAGTINSLYADLIFTFLDVPASLSATLSDREVAAYLNAYVSTSRVLDSVDAERPLGQNVLDQAFSDNPNQRDVREFATVIGSTNNLWDDATRDVAALLKSEAALLPPEGQATAIRLLLAQAQPEAVTPALAARWQEISQGELDKMIPVRDVIRTFAVDASQDQQASERTAAINTIIVTVVTLLASVFVAFAISRRITVPLRNLTRAAAHVRDELPKLVEQVAVPGQGPEISIDPIKVESSDEVGQLAAAFNDVNATTVEVAKEQAALRGSIAEMFVNVARRDHVLLNRQLAFLDELERSEEDANTLANLFRLDHLATRMRRNSESLLVLAGIDSGRRVRQPMPMSDVVRTASSEIELYDRVRLNLEADPLMLGHNALNGAHLLAELLENATMFSEPNTPVEVTTNRSSRYVTVEVRDHGLGMNEEEILQANTKVASRSASDVIGVQRLGLFVVGRLADRLGAHVVFSRAADGSAGTIATVSFPLALFVDEADVPLAAPTDPLHADTRQATEEWVAPSPEASSTLPVEEEPPAGIPVDLAALTDGSTSLGMPRRRKSLAPDPVQTAPGVGIDADLSTSTNSMVLPALEAANPDVDLTSADDARWAPDRTLAESLPSGLPSRARTESGLLGSAFTPLETVRDEPLLDGERRSAMFSSFRTRSSVAETTAPATGQTAAQPQDVHPAEDAPVHEEQAHHEESRSVQEYDEPAAHDEPAYAEPAADDEPAAYEETRAHDEPAQHEPAHDEPAAYDAHPAHDEHASHHEAPAEDSVPTWDASPAAQGSDEAAWSRAEWSTRAESALEAASPETSEQDAEQHANVVDEVAQQHDGLRSSILHDEIVTPMVPVAEADSVEAPTEHEPSGEPTLPVRSAHVGAHFASQPDQAEAAAPPAMVIPGLVPDEDELPEWQAAPSDEPRWEPQPDEPDATFAPVERFEPLPAFGRSSAAPEPEPEVAPTPRRTSVFGSADGTDVPYEPAPARRFLVEPETDQAFQPVQQFEPLNFSRPSSPAPMPQRTPVADAAPAPMPQRSPSAAPAPQQSLAPAPMPQRTPAAAPAPQSFAPAPQAYQPTEQLAPVEPEQPFTPQERFRPLERFEPLGSPDRTEQAAAPQAYAPQAPARAPEVRAPEASAQAPAAAASQPTLPSFADVVSDAPTRRGSRETSKKGGLFGWLRRGRDESTDAPEPEAPAATPAPAPAAEPAPLAVSGFQSFSPEPTVPARLSPAFPAERKPAPMAQREPVAPEPAPRAAAPTFAPAPTAAPVQAFTPAPVQPAAPAAGSWAPAAPADGADETWTPRRRTAPAAQGPSAPLDELPLTGLDTGESWSPPTQINGDIASMLAMRSNIQEQALAELSQLSAYRPAEVASQAGGLTRRTRGHVAASTDDVTSQKISRDAAELRSRLSAFQSATSRGRQAPAAAQGTAPGADAGEPVDATV